MDKKSSYLLKLEKEHPDVGRRYFEKVKMIDFVDPFTISDQDLDFSMDAVPPVSSMDIVSYLVLTHNSFTAEQMKAYKSLSAYKYFEAGFVRVGCIKLSEFYVLIGKVKHSQRANEKPLDVWVITQLQGSVCTAHCTCMAGNCETCSHVGAVLFAADYANRVRESTSCTDVKAAWPVPAPTKVPIVPIAQMNWGSRISKSTAAKCCSLNPADIQNLLTDLEEASCSSALARIVEPLASQMDEDCSAIMNNVFNVYNIDFETKTYEELLSIGQSLDIQISPEDCLKIESVTRKQSSSTDWFTQRSGRITASKFKLCCNYNKQQPSLSLIKSVCYPVKMTFSTKATSWGIKNEINAVNAYYKEFSSSHVALEIKFLIKLYYK